MADGELKLYLSKFLLCVVTDGGLETGAGGGGVGLFSWIFGVGGDLSFSNPNFCLA